MTVAVQPDPMAGSDYLLDERGISPHLLADQEERRARVRASQQLQHGGRALRMGSVVEGERDPGGGQHPRQTESAGGAGEHWRERVAKHTVDDRSSCARKERCAAAIPVRPW